MRNHTGLAYSGDVEEMKVTQLIDRCLYGMLAKCGIVNAVERHRRCYPVLLMWHDITLEERVPF